MRQGSLWLSQPCHFGEWLQGRLGPQGPVVLVTLLPRGVVLRAGYAAAARLSVAGGQVGAGFPVAPLRLRGFLAGLGLPVAGRFTLRPAFAPGLGTGASTASLIAIARLAGFRGRAEDLARACVAAEGASDPLMFAAADRLLWASRQGRVLGRMPAVPQAQMLAGFFGPALPTRAVDQDYADVSDLVGAWRRARGLADCAAIASESAARCLARRGPGGDPTAQLARDLGALGWVTSHSGAARGLVFPPGPLPPGAEGMMREAGLRGVRRLVTGG